MTTRYFRSPAFGKLAILLAVVALWQLAASLTSRIFLPSFTDVLSSLYSVFVAGTLPGLPYAVGVTLLEVVAAFFLAAGLGLFVGFSLSYNRLLGLAYLPLVIAVASIPHIIFFPTMVVLFGLGPMSKVAYGVLAAFPVITLGTMAAISQVSRATLDVARSLGARKYTLFLKVILPSSASSILSTLRVGFGVTLVTTLIAEMLGSLTGLGFYLRSEYEGFQTPQYFALVILVMIFAFGMNTASSFIERRARAWLHE